MIPFTETQPSINVPYLSIYIKKDLHHSGLCQRKIKLNGSESGVSESVSVGHGKLFCIVCIISLQSNLLCHFYITTTYEHLGIVVDEHLSFKSHIGKLLDHFSSFAGFWRFAFYEGT